MSKAITMSGIGVRRKPGVLHCAGRTILQVAGRCYRLEDFVPTAHVPGAWAASWVEALSSPSVTCVTTIENEFPVLAYVDEAGGPEGLGARGEIAVYTAGFPTPLLADSLAAIARRDPVKRFQHWGDADAGGLRIWWLLRTRVARPVALVRTTAAWVACVADEGGGARLESGDRAALRRLRDQLSSAPCTADDDVRDAIAMIDVLLALGVKVEQERY